MTSTPHKHWEDYWSSQSDREWWQRPAPEVMELIRGHSSETHGDVLDLGCGLGRHAIAFALAGFRVAATDASAAAVARTAAWAKSLGLEVATCICDVRDRVFPAESFDLVVSYNVIYHGCRADFARAIARVQEVLRPGGLFFFTCPTRRDGKYGHGPEVAAHTFACENSVTPGDIHYFADDADLRSLLDGFELRGLRADEGFWDNQGRRQFYSNWLVLAGKPAGT